MSFLDLARSRFSVRKYQPRAVEQDTIMKVLEAARLAPSACNFQPWHFIVIRNNLTKQKLKRAYDRQWFLEAPVIIAVCVDRKKSWKRSDKKEYGEVDAAIAMDHLILAATEMGLGTCWIGAFNDKEARTALNLPDNIDPVVLTPLGYPDEPSHEKKRAAINDIVCWEHYGSNAE